MIMYNVSSNVSLATFVCLFSIVYYQVYGE